MSARFELAPTPLAGLSLCRRRPLADERGEFERLFCAEELAAAGFSAGAVQVNRSLTRRVGAVRGLHFQYPPHAEFKLVTCLSGRVFDVAVDVRRDSPTFLRYIGIELLAGRPESLLLPPGFAHGFQALEENSVLLYCHSTAYAPGAEGGIHAEDPRLAIPWPLPVAQLSPRDAGFAWLAQDFDGVAL
ncbi:dTDP-4-dehydrorhamnose 3,5-epimerase family protein [Paludibacterium yongneupense]|uniref:dTDP-4-dehydrorhamnose 3,5-epimerase family protein n=1 Tax=Paludibacterium yongneupense TaxID=400061 RepID=UPI000422C817|nr:dTDP-4-dehydrorhamnose 3,5-epimerase family protein [Paludibacterium yongneupense]